MNKPLLLLALVFVLQACNGNDDETDGGPYAADIVWTEYGIPHITANDWGGLGYGYGYAFSQENYCVLMKEFVRANGESARYLDDGDIDDDFVWKYFNNDERIQTVFVDSLSDQMQQLGSGYIAGINRYLEETGVDNLAEGEDGCRGAEWVREVTIMDMGRLLHKLMLYGSGGQLGGYMVAAEPTLPLVKASPKPTAALLAKLDTASMIQKLAIPENQRLGSNAYGIGADASANQSGILFGNPHFPWQGPRRFYMSHLTIPGVYDASGGSLYGIPIVLIGFNENLAWSHTVSYANRFTFYELTLNPANPLEYEYDGETRTIEPVIVSAENADGSSVEHTFYESHFGPILDLGGLSPLLAGWPNDFDTVLTYRDANLENFRGFDQWIGMGQAANLDEFIEEMKAIGIPWVNTIAADRYGDALYSDISTVPHVTEQKLNDCARGIIATTLTGMGRPTLDGSDSDCEWGNDDGAPEGVFGFDSLPILETREYGANANDSHWLSSPRQLLEGFSPLTGPERYEQTLRSRLTFVQAEERLDDTDGLNSPDGFSVEQVKTISYSSRNHAAELVLDDLVTLCSAVGDWSTYSSNPASIAEACTLLGSWDGTHTLDSVGAHIFHEFWRIARDMEELWQVPFDAADPVNTPNTLNVANGTVAEDLRQALATGVDVLLTAGITLDQPWGDVQFDEKNGVRIPIHGGSSAMLFNVISSDLVDGEGYSAIEHGNSYMQAVTWDETGCPDASAMLTYSQSTDPTSAHYADATALYSEGGWIDMAYCEADIEAAELRRVSISQ